MTTLAHLMNKDIQKIDHHASVQEAAQRMKEKKIGSLLVEKDGEYVGIITETDIVRRAAAVGLDMKKESIGSIMSKGLITLAHDRTPRDAHDMMGESGVRHLAVTEAGKVVGVVSVRDILLYFKGHSEPNMGID